MSTTHISIDSHNRNTPLLKLLLQNHFYKITITKTAPMGARAVWLVVRWHSDGRPARFPGRGPVSEKREV
jgi:hypothetical protein